jgi:hypothetical protein
MAGVGPPGCRIRRTRANRPSGFGRTVAVPVDGSDRQVRRDS